MDESEFCRVQSRLMWSGVRLARFLGIHENSVSNYRRGEKIPGPVSRCMGLLDLLEDFRQGVHDG